ncbi:hypothetical protein [Streptomyces exfoliatus]|nr:hypothetical protein [Streptomyces exfoliatus]
MSTSFRARRHAIAAEQQLGKRKPTVAVPLSHTLDDVVPQQVGKNLATDREVRRRGEGVAQPYGDSPVLVPVRLDSPASRA